LLVIPLVIRLISGVVDNLEAPKTSKRELVMKEPPPLDPKKPEPPPPPKMPPAPPRPTVKFTPPEVVKDEEVVDPPPTKEELKTAAAGPETKNEGPGDINAITPPGEGSEGPSNGVVSDAPPAPVTWVEQMPEFPGGERAMTDFIQKHFRVSDAARESEIAAVQEANTIEATENAKKEKAGADAELAEAIPAMERATEAVNCLKVEAI